MKVVQKVLVTRTAEEVWEVVGRRFGDVATWATAVDASRPLVGVGPGGASCTGRACAVDTPGFGEVVEELTAYDDRARTLAYRATSGMPRFVREARMSWTVEKAPAGSSVFTMRADVSFSPLGALAGPLLRVYLARIARVTCHDLAAITETGVPRRSPTGHGVGALRRPVAVNAAFSGLCGVVLAAGATRWAGHLGGASPLVVALLGLALVGYGLGLAGLLGRGVPAATGRVLAGLDAAWVVGTAGLLLTVGHRFTGVGLVATVSTALIVGTLGAWQWSASGEARARGLSPWRTDASRPG